MLIFLVAYKFKSKYKFNLIINRYKLDFSKNLILINKFYRNAPMQNGPPRMAPVPPGGGVNRPAPAPPGARVPPGMISGGGPPPNIQNRPLPGPPGSGGPPPMAPM